MTGTALVYTVSKCFPMLFFTSKYRDQMTSFSRCWSCFRFAVRDFSQSFAEVLKPGVECELPHGSAFTRNPKLGLSLRTRREATLKVASPTWISTIMKQQATRCRLSWHKCLHFRNSESWQKILVTKLIRRARRKRIYCLLCSSIQ